MPAVQQRQIIKPLPSQLANQIAAGEVIERPASVVKELLENALDAGAGRIDIELTNGGMNGIMITDNGIGIRADELPLAIARHATSKIESIDDLLALHSLGFRGEALASMCSVSQWEIVSRNAASELAAKLSHQLPEQVLEVNHAIGTSVTINNLFHNTPARRKFLRAERTEFRHCDEVIKRMALARFDVGFYVNHNSKQTLRLPAASDDSGRARRVAQVCSQNFINQSLTIDYPHNNMRLRGWVSQAEFSRQSTDMQYFYINGRIIRDRVINHAIRMAYQNILPPGRHAVYILHFEIDPASVDVNVHPTKHEVRFAESRLIHDFISRSLRDALGVVGVKGVAETSATYISQETPLPNNSYSPIPMPAEYETNDSMFGRVLSIVHSRFALTQIKDQQVDKFYLIDLARASALWVASHWLNSYSQQQVKSQPLLVPQRLTLTDQQRINYQLTESLLIDLGIQLSAETTGDYLLRYVPNLCRTYVSDELCINLLNTKLHRDDLQDQIINLLTKTRFDSSKLNLTEILITLSDKNALQTVNEFADCWRELDESSLQEWFKLSS
ncbi:DNA mismatch repair protein MutL [hydrothermal vent metagenome]|uniref:DNA mismatch repair protein MutL n=1 Tax=hydrothermal vent metagenome TaxID=652676 RepID=A0A3B1AJM6_9ZZZZ